jgi:predicted nucleotidyltransferase
MADNALVTDEELPQTLRDILEEESSIVTAILFGSCASHRLAAHSDIDLAVAAVAPLDLQEKARLVILLEGSLRRRVDLLDLHSLRGSILHQVLTKGILLKNSDPALLAGFIKKMLYHQADMMPLVKRMLLAKARRFAYGQDRNPEKASEPLPMRGAHRDKAPG